MAQATPGKKLSAPPLPIPAFQWDLARQTERIGWLRAQLPRYADWGYRELYLHLEDAVEYPSLPGVARPGAYTHRELGSLVKAAERVGIRVVPIVNLLGHAQYLLKVPSLRDLSELLGDDGSPISSGQICPLHPRTPVIAAKLLGDVAPFCTAGKVHVGLDESYHLGRHPLSRREIAEVGLAAHFARYVGSLRALARRRGLRLGMWADMLALIPGSVRLLPPGVIAYDWYYYPFRGSPRIELRNFQPYDLAPALRDQGIEYWGCPMDGAFRHEPLPIFSERLANIVGWWKRCRATRAAGMLITSWEPQRIAIELAQAVDAAAASLWLEREEDPARMWELGCRRVFGRRGPAAARALLAADAFPCAGYPAWRRNERWDTSLGADPPPAGEHSRFHELARRPGLPPAASASLRFRAYLATRDQFVAEAGKTVAALRAAHGRSDRPGVRATLREALHAAAAFGREIRPGRAAARAMWRRTRSAKLAGPNERLVSADEARLKSWRSWLLRCRRRPAQVRSASPIAGPWQLVFEVRNFAPAAQKVVVERRIVRRRWEDLHGMFLIEFQARAARPRAEIRHRMSAPLPWRGPPEKIPDLRIAVRGFGAAEIGRVHLTDGVRRIRALGGAKILGRPAPMRGYPDFDWAADRGLWTLRWPAFQDSR